MSAEVDLGVDQLSFPILCLSRDTSISVAAAPERLTRCNAVAFFKNRYFDDVVILNANAEQFRVVQAEPHPRLTGARRWFTRVFNRSIVVNLQLRREGAPSIDRAKQQVIAWLDKAPDFWEESRDLSEWKLMINDATDIRQVVQLFS